MSLTHRARVYELASLSACEAICSRDREIKGYQPRYVTENLLSYYAAINTWLIIIDDYSPGGSSDVLYSLVHRGLLSVVDEFAAAADCLVHGMPVTSDLVADILRGVEYAKPVVRVTNHHRPSEFSMKLQICRYLKRTTFQYRPDTEKAAKDGFHEAQLDLISDVIPRYDDYPNVISAIRNILAGALPWDDICARLEEMRDPVVGPRMRTFTSGASSDAGTAFSAKLKWMGATNPLFFRPIMGSWITPPSMEGHCEWVDESYYLDMGCECRDRHKHTVRISTAPKSVKGPRIIAMEPVDKQSAQRFAKDILYRYFPEGVDLTDQTINQERAFEGSVNGRYATIDLSSASDFVTKPLVRKIFPQRFCDAIWWMVPTHYELRKKEYPLYSFATMGNGLTFWVESMVFWAISRLWAPHGEVCVYGDDIIVPTDAANRVIFTLEELGFRVNRDKTFTSGDFRESCGVECLAGDYVQPVYYPRFPVRGEITEHTCTFSNYTSVEDGDYVDTTIRIVKLQQRLTEVSLNAARFLRHLLADAHPNMTQSKYGSSSSDVWGPEDITGPDAWAAVGTITHTVVQGPPVEGSTDTCVVIREWVATPQSNRPDAGLRHTRYAPIAKDSPKETNDSDGLFDEYLYWQFLEKGPTWRESDGWLPSNAWLPSRERLRLTAKVVEWGLRSL